jgi:hypothetical protein
MVDGRIGLSSSLGLGAQQVMANGVEPRLVDHRNVCLR